MKLSMYAGNSCAAANALLAAQPWGRKLVARKRTVIAVAIRIALRASRGQSADNYAELMDDAFNLKKMVNVRGPEHMLLSSLSERAERSNLSTSRRRVTSMEGVISKFTEIDLTGDWFNAETLKVASANDRREIAIPKRLKPNHSAHFFEFFPETHTFAVQTYGTGQALSASMALRFLSALFDDLAISTKWGRVSVSLIQHKAALDEVFDLKVLKKLTFIVVPPNGDDQSKWEKRFEEQMEEEKLKRLEIIRIAEAGKSITPSKETKDQAEAVLQMGAVIGRGRDQQGAPKVVSSVDYPDAEPVKYDPDKQSEKQAFDKAAGLLIKRTRLSD